MCLAGKATNIITGIHSSIAMGKCLAFLPIFDLEGPKHPTSIGWRICEQCGGSTNRIILLVLAHSIRSKEKWLLWPSYKISIGSDESRPWTCFMKWSWRFSLKTCAFDHPEAVTVPAASWLLSFIKSGIIRCPGKIKKRRYLATNHIPCSDNSNSLI